MPNDKPDQTADSSAKNAEQHVKNMLGPSPTETDKHADEPPGAPPVGTVITPDQQVESELVPEPKPTKTEPEKSEAQPTIASNQQISKLDKLKRLFKKWWANKKTRWLTIVGLTVLILAILLLPGSRYFVLNSVGVRSSASLTIVDDSTQLPLKNVQVKLANGNAQTDDEGKVSFAHLKLGNAKLTITKRAFATSTKNITIGWGSNPLGSFSIKAVGTQFDFVATDWLSGKPIGGAEAAAGDANAVSDDKGKITLTVDPSEVNDAQTVTIKADGYRDETFNLGTDTTNTRTIKLVPARKEVYISNRSGRYDLYSVDVDGKNEKLVLAGTGLENGNIALLPHISDEVVALVSTRVNVRNSDGFLLTTLTLVTLKDNSSLTIAQSEQIKLIGWAGDNLVYLQVAAGASAANTARYRLISYDYKTADKKELARANYFNDALLIGDKIYFALSSTDQTDGSLTRIAADGSGKQTLLSKEVWNIFRSSYDTLDLSTDQSWYQYKLGDSNATKLSQAPANPTNRLYVASPDGSQNLWVDERDGKGVLLDYQTADSQDKILQTQSGLSYPVRWLDDKTLIYRIHTDSETSDWVMSIDGGTTHKIKDVYNTSSLDPSY